MFTYGIVSFLLLKSAVRSLKIHTQETFFTSTEWCEKKVSCDLFYVNRMVWISRSTMSSLMLQHPRSLGCTRIFWKSSILVPFTWALQFVIAFPRGSPKASSPKHQRWSAKFLQHWLMSTSHCREVLSTCSSLGSWWKEQVLSISPRGGKGGWVVLQQWKTLQEEYDLSVRSPQISFLSLDIP